MGVGIVRVPLESTSPNGQSRLEIKPLKTTLVSLIFLPLAVAVLSIPLHRLVQPLWPEKVVERLDAENRPVLDPVAGVDSPARLRSTPRSAAVIDRIDGSPVLGYVVGLRDADGTEQPLPGDGFWWPSIVLPGCSLAVSVQRVVEWMPCSEIARVHHPNRITSAARFKIAVDRLIGPPAAVPPFDAPADDGGLEAPRHETDMNAG